VVDPKVWFGIKTDDDNDEHKKQHLKCFSGTDKAPKKVLAQLQCCQHHNDGHRDQHQVIVIIDLQYRREFIDQRFPDFIKLGNVVIPVIKNSNEKENGQKPDQTCNPFPPVERAVQQQAQPKHNEQHNKREIDQRTQSNDHSYIKHGHHTIGCFTDLQKFIHDPDQQEITDQRWT